MALVVCCTGACRLRGVGLLLDDGHNRAVGFGGDSLWALRESGALELAKGAILLHNIGLTSRIGGNNLARQSRLKARVCGGSQSVHPFEQTHLPHRLVRLRPAVSREHRDLCR